MTKMQYRNLEQRYHETRRQVRRLKGSIFYLRLIMVTGWSLFAIAQAQYFLN
ncbi:hypothetical protein [Algicola sagamiensis]|uniref:hypothetical protein n=1 Tax=Algicola sagamiensis TaxID=163869 RepID=UPI000377E893|nr:hypothetical protein [Algicola sagamiensis]